MNVCRADITLMWVLVFIFFFISLPVSGQRDSSQVNINFSGFADIYFMSRSGVSSQAASSFLYNHDRNNEFNINLALLKCSVKGSKYRANLAVHTGSYVEENYIQEPGIFRFVHEANVGISLDKKQKVWLDAGIMPSHIGFEGAVSKDNLTLTRSILAENSPYYETGLQLSYQAGKSWIISFLVLNGWQRIRKVEGNSSLAFGHRIVYQKNDQFLFNWSSFLGTDDPDVSRRMRFFNNFYIQGQVNPKFKYIAGFDIGVQQTKKGSALMQLWYSPVLIGQWLFHDKWRTAIRGEYYQDKDGVIINAGGLQDFTLGSVSCNLDFAPTDALIARFESRWLFPLFEFDYHNEWRLSVSLAASF